MQTIITHAEALAILGDDDAADHPIRVLNQKGEELVQKWVRSTSFRLIPHIAAWFENAEDVANDTQPDFDIVMEMSGTETRSQTPETLNIPADCFDWVVNK